MNTVNKGQLVDTLASATGEAKSTVDKVINGLIETVGSTLKKGDRISLVGFGAFESRKRPARTGRNPRTGAAIKIKAATVPVFKAGSALRDVVAGKKAAAKAAKKAAPTKAAAKKSAPAKQSGAAKKSAPAKRAAARKAAPAKKTAAKETAAKKTAAKKTAAKKTAAKKTAAKKTAAKKTAAKKTTAKKTTAKKR